MSNRNILLTVTGLTPQVITETCYYLLCKKRPKVKISEIISITTAKGKEILLKTLLSPIKGKFYQFCRDYNIDPATIKFNDETIIVLKGKGGKYLNDIRTKTDNEYIADQINDLIKKLTGDKNTSLHCSIAGGRKTMSVYLASALQLYGRKQDTLSHVLVSPAAFENHKDFFYKPKKDVWLTASDGSRINTKDAKIELAEIPVIRLRKKFKGSTKGEKASFSEIINQFQGKIDSSIPHPTLRLNHRKMDISTESSSATLPPIQYVIYRYFVSLKTEHCKQPKQTNCEGCIDCYQEMYNLETNNFYEMIQKYYSEIYKEETLQMEKLKRIWQKNKEISDNLRTNILRLKKTLKSRLGGTEYYFLKIDNIVDRRPTKYGIRLNKRNISETLR